VKGLLVDILPVVASVGAAWPPMKEVPTVSRTGRKKPMSSSALTAYPSEGHLFNSGDRLEGQPVPPIPSPAVVGVAHAGERAEVRPVEGDQPHGNKGREKAMDKLTLRA